MTTLEPCGGGGDHTYEKPPQSPAGAGTAWGQIPFPSLFEKHHLLSSVFPRGGERQEGRGTDNNLAHWPNSKTIMGDPTG